MRAGRGATPAKELFRDATFPAADSSLFCDLSTPLAQFREDITWRRPQEICATPRLFPDDPREGQVKQGLLGDCWFLCACAALQKSRHLLEQVIPPGQPSWADQEYRGSFTCRIWQFGRWVEVTTDDRLPCLAGRLCFSRCQREDVFWLPLLEKGPWVLRAPVGRAGGGCPGGPDRRPGRKMEPEGRSRKRRPAGQAGPLGAQDLSAAAPPEGPVSDQLLRAQPQSRCPGAGGVPCLHCLGPAGAPGSGGPVHPAAADPEPLGPAVLAGALERGG
ncbi:CAPN10 isoform 6 [Pan troglodytes]|uniref:CAPN10 isoform 6 n=1 Tax=Pan troglodytes TaxID=9598 RepID=A0A2J8IYK7_PANTR|nr:CAPN10 isoform 6 [Pan troglodytes]